MKTSSRHTLAALVLTLATLLSTTVPASATVIDSQGHERPTVAVVLAGGGAKGIAHISALQLLEDAGIPIDIVVGTSMGSIVGGMYSLGYSPEMMSEITLHTDWFNLILDNPDFATGQYQSRINKETYLLRFKTDRKRLASGTGFGGIIEGENVVRLFNILSEHVPDSVDFDQLPIRFACVGTNMMTGQKYVFRSGNLPTAIRTSMSIPAFFTPVELDGQYYVDGGVLDNYPVDVARDMGADIVIGINLVHDVNPKAVANNPVEVMMQLLNLLGDSQRDINIRNTDLYIPIDVTGYSAASFGHADCDSLLQIGLRDTRPHLDELRALHDRLGIQGRPDRIRVGEYDFAADGSLHVTSHSKEHDDEVQASLLTMARHMTDSFVSQHKDNKSAVGIGARFDSEEYASLLLTTDFVLSHKRNLTLEFNVRLGERMVGELDFNFHLFKSWRLGFWYQFRHYNMHYYLEGDDWFSYKTNENHLNLYLTHEWNDFKIDCGVEQVFNKFYHGMSDDDLVWGNLRESYFVPYIVAEYNSLDRSNYPTQGHLLHLGADVNTLIYRDGKKQDQDVIPKLFLRWQSAFTMGSRFTVIPHLGTNMIVGQDGYALTESLANPYGGLGDGIQQEDQLGMAGVTQMERSLYSIVVGGLTLQQRIGSKQFVTGTWDVCSEYCMSTNSFARFMPFEEGHFNTGLQLTYGINTKVGPVSLEGNWSDLTHKFRLFFNMGYYF